MRSVHHYRPIEDVNATTSAPNNLSQGQYQITTDGKMAHNVGCSFICVLSGKTTREQIDESRATLACSPVANVLFDKVRQYSSSRVWVSYSLDDARVASNALCRTPIFTAEAGKKKRAGSYTQHLTAYRVS